MVTVKLYRAYLFQRRRKIEIVKGNLLSVEVFLLFFFFLKKVKMS